MKVILGIDPGLTHTGYGIISVDGNRYVKVGCGTIKTDPADRTAKRLRQLYHDMADIINQHRPEEAGIESLFFARNVKTAFPVAEAKGVILLCLAENNVPAYDYTPLEVKKAVVGKGRADKKQVQRMVRMILGLQTLSGSDHVSDALAIAICHHHCSHKQKMVEGQTDV